MKAWYIIHAVAGSEGKVRDMIIDQAKRKNLSDKFEEVFVPVVEVPEIRRGKAIKVEKKMMPGYILVKMEMSDDTQRLLRSLPGAGYLLGNKEGPARLSNSEVEEIFSQIEKQSEKASNVGLYQVGQKVNVNDGPFDGFSGIIESVDNASQRLKVKISIFGKETSMDLGFTQVSKD